MIVVIPSLWKACSLSGSSGRERRRQWTIESNKEKESLVKKMSTIYKLAPMKIDGLLYVGGRLTQASIPNAAKHQIILPKKHDSVTH